MLEKKEYGKLFNEGLYQPSIQDIIAEEDLPVELQGKGIQAYSTGTDFKMLVSVQRNIGNNSERSWNEYEGKNKRKFLCTSYIRNDMLGTIARDPFGNFGDGDELTFGFSYMNEESFLFSANQDARTDKGTTETKHGYAIKNYTPDELIDNMETNGIMHNYNEVGFERIQDGKIKQPSYIVVFVKDGLIDVDPNILIKALNDWKGKLKLVIVDIDKCLEAEKNKVKKMLEEYRNGNKSIGRDIIQKIKNNRHTDSNFCSDIKEVEEIIQEQYDKSDKSEIKYSSYEQEITELRNKMQLYWRCSNKDKANGINEGEELFKTKCGEMGLNWLKELENAYMLTSFRRRCDKYYISTKDKSIENDLRKKAERLGLDYNNEMKLAEKRYWVISRIKSKVSKGIDPTDIERDELEKLGLNFEVDVLGDLLITIDKKNIESIVSQIHLTDIEKVTHEIKENYLEFEKKPNKDKKNKGKYEE